MVSETQYQLTVALRTASLDKTMGPNGVKATIEPKSGKDYIIRNVVSAFPGSGFLNHRILGEPPTPYGPHENQSRASEADEDAVRIHSSSARFEIVLCYHRAEIIWTSAR
jgi:hypothetical protein